MNQNIIFKYAPIEQRVYVRYEGDHNHGSGSGVAIAFGRNATTETIYLVVRDSEEGPPVWIGQNSIKSSVVQ